MTDHLLRGIYQDFRALTTPQERVDFLTAYARLGLPYRIHWGALTRAWKDQPK